MLTLTIVTCQPDMQYHPIKGEDLDKCIRYSFKIVLLFFSLNFKRNFHFFFIKSNWRSSGSGNDGSTNLTSSQSVSKTIDITKQKRGAERLFQYFEADDSDPEDYTR